MALPQLTDEQRAAALEKAGATPDMTASQLCDILVAQFTSADFIEIIITFFTNYVHS